jgi:NNP family nitrate/nitrite transporter-like MFS transporter
VTFINFIPMAGAATGDGAYLAFIAFYGLFVLVTWAVYLLASPRRRSGA